MSTYTQQHLSLRACAFALMAQVAISGACFTAEFDRTASGVFACEVPDDCPGDELCLAGTCIDDAGPQIEFTGPEDLQRFDVAEYINLPITVRGIGLTLGPPTGTDRAGHGYLEILVDGAAVQNGIIDSGTLEVGAQSLAPINIFNPAPGLHRVTAQAMRADGTPYRNPSSTAHVTFWVDDGRPQVGIRRPWPGEVQLRGSDIDVEVVTLNFDFVNPKASVDDTNPGEGHTHIYVNSDYPECLPGCNFNYVKGGSIKPEGNARAKIVQGTLTELPTNSEVLELTASLNASNHIPIPATSLDAAEPSWLDGSMYPQLVNDTVVVQLVTPGGGR